MYIRFDTEIRGGKVLSWRLLRIPGKIGILPPRKKDFVTKPAEAEKTWENRGLRLAFAESFSER